MSRQPSPLFLSVDASDLSLTHSKFGGYRTLRGDALHSQYFADFRLSQLRDTMSFAAIVGIVQKLVGLILFRRSPTQMCASNASQMALAASVGGLVFWCRWWTIFILANYPGNDSTAAAPVFDRGIATAICPVRPEQAFIARIWQNHFVQIAQRLAFWRSPSSRVAVPFPPPVMRVTPSVRYHWALATTVNAAYSWGSHFEPRSFVSVRARLVALQTLGGLVFYRPVAGEEQACANM